MTEKQKRPKHWSETVITITCILSILGIVVTDNAMGLWATPPPDLLYWGLGAIGLGVTTEQIKEILLSFVNTWIKTKMGSEGDK